MPAANGIKGKKAKRVKNKAKNMRIHGKVKNPITSHRKAAAKMHTEMAKMIDSSYRVWVLSDV